MFTSSPENKSWNWHYLHFTMWYYIITKRLTLIQESVMIGVHMLQVTNIHTAWWIRQQNFSNVYNSKDRKVGDAFSCILDYLCIFLQQIATIDSKIQVLSWMTCISSLPSRVDKFSQCQAPYFFLLYCFVYFLFQSWSKTLIIYVWCKRKLKQYEKCMVTKKNKESCETSKLSREREAFDPQVTRCTPLFMKVVSVTTQYWGLQECPSKLT